MTDSTHQSAGVVGLEVDATDDVHADDTFLGGGTWKIGEDLGGHFYIRVWWQRVNLESSLE